MVDRESSVSCALEPGLEYRPRILVVDDDRETTRLVTEILTAERYDVEVVGTGAEAELAIERFQPDLTILDVVLPDTDGLMVCTRLLDRWPAPIIMLSGSQKPSDRLLSFRLGADDFIAKPFDVLDLVLRVEAVIRRSSRTNRSVSLLTMAPTTKPAAAPDGVIVLGALKIDTRSRVVTIGGEVVGLTPSEHRLLATLAEQHDRVFDRDELAESLWQQGLADESRAIDVHVRRLRAKLEPFREMSPEIVTVRGFGYRLAARPGPLDRP